MSSSIGRHYGKTDLERVGYFDDPPSAPFDVYRKPAELREGINKGRQILDGTTGGLFHKKFQRIFEGEPIYEPWRQKIKEEIQHEKGKISGRMLPPSPSKKHSTPGDWHGCFDKPVYLGPALKDEAKKKKVERLPANFKIKPNPLGGPGYVDICINPYPLHSHEPYDREIATKGAAKTSVGKFLSASAPMDYFPPNPYVEKGNGPMYVAPTEKSQKFVGTGRLYVPFPKDPRSYPDGCFDKFPSYTSEPYESHGKSKEVKAEPRWLAGGPSLRTKYTSSIIERITNVSCNSANYSHYRERAYPLTN